MQFGVSMVWRDPTNHVGHFHLCMTPPMNMGWSRKMDRLQYACIPSVIKPVPHWAHMPIPDSSRKYEIVRNYFEEEFIRPGVSYDPDFKAEDLNEPHKLNQAEFSDLVKHFDLSKEKA
ncbi:hypothetical protein TNCT_214161 [Trichonephila clavata]|uniref:Uncharacterized protein n=1 Tax=Trichonephila clavata TaxID=2740835 RepID=A0A8X6H7B4_TRICU|nr:hypothetical protein TNCT_214161 [Trichonephila clavata]